MLQQCIIYLNYLHHIALAMTILVQLDWSVLQMKYVNVLHL